MMTDRQTDRQKETYIPKENGRVNEVAAADFIFHETKKAAVLLAGGLECFLLLCRSPSHEVRVVVGIRRRVEDFRHLTEIHKGLMWALGRVSFDGEDERV